MSEEEKQIQEQQQKEEGAEQVEHMSKKQRKRLEKQEKMKELKVIRKQKRKNRKQQLKEIRKQEQQEIANNSSGNPEKEEKKQENQPSTGSCSIKKNQKKDIYNEKQSQGIKVVLDMQFQDLLNDAEMKSLASQVILNYSVNRKEEHPFNYIVSSYTPGCPVDKLQHERNQEGCNINYDERSFVDIFADQKENIIYLTGDAEEEMEELEKDKIYIIGGMVDHNRLKKVSYDKAKELGIKCQKFPIEKHIKLFTSQILNINHVFCILNKLKNGSDWPTALQECIPKRKQENRGNSQYSKVDLLEQQIKAKKLKREQEQQEQQQE